MNDNLPNRPFLISLLPRASLPIADLGSYPIPLPNVFHLRLQVDRLVIVSVQVPIRHSVQTNGAQAAGLDTGR